MSGVRDMVQAISPPWLADGVAQEYLYAPGVILDSILDSTVEAVNDRMPGVGDPSALPLIGADRLILRGQGEPDASYAARLTHAFPTWRSAGSAGAVLRQLIAYLQLSILVRTVSNTAAWDTIEAGAVPDASGDLPVEHFLGASNFDWDGNAAAWWRAWVIIYGDGGVPWSGEGTWGDGQLWGDGGVWGLTATTDQVQSIRLLVRTWKAAHVVVPWIIVAPDASFFVPTGASLPDGTWGRWSKTVAGVQSPSRSAPCRFVQGVI